MRIILRFVTLLLFAQIVHAQVQIVDNIGACNEGDVGKWSVAAGKFVCNTPGIVTGVIVMIASGTCPASFTEVAGLNGKTLFGTIAANGDVGTTGGSDRYSTWHYRA